MKLTPKLMGAVLTAASIFLFASCGSAYTCPTYSRSNVKHKEQLQGASQRISTRLI